MTPFNPANILRGDDGRWYHDGVDVTDMPLWWRCQEDPCHEPWQASIGQRTSGTDAGCPACWAGKLSESVSPPLAVDERADFLAWYLFLSDWTSNEIGMAHPTTVVSIRTRWTKDDPASEVVRDRYRARAERFLRVPDGNGDGETPPSRCAAIPPDRGDACWLAPGHRGDNHRDHSGRTWPKEKT